MTQRYIFNNGTVTDADNDVMWKLNAEEKDGDPELFTFDEAKARFRGFDEAGDFDDWRLPTLNECKGIIDSELFRQWIKVAVLLNRITGNGANGYWTSTPSGNGNAWGLRFKEGEETFFKSTPDKLYVSELDVSAKLRVVLCRTID